MGFLVPTREHRPIYLSSGPWSSTEEDFAYVRHLEELFARSHILFWRISIVEYWTQQGDN
jgi:hypothetical protein